MEKRPSSLWFVAQLKPNCGPIAERNLNRQGFRSFLPMERRTRRRNGRLKSIRSPYFPGYIFVGVDAHSTPSRAINSTYGISRLISFGLQAAPVPSEIMEALLSSCDSEGCIQNFVQVAEGDEVQICDGPFTSFIGRIEKLAPDERAWLLIDIMGKATRSLIRRADVRRTRA
jgi:transcriptional antiterminator RfaH